jgi:hypothetical protein
MILKGRKGTVANLKRSVTKAGEKAHPVKIYHATEEGDRVKIAGTPNSDGVLESTAYNNKTTGVRGGMSGMKSIPASIALIAFTWFLVFVQGENWCVLPFGIFGVYWLLVSIMRLIRWLAVR